MPDGEVTIGPYEGRIRGPTPREDLWHIIEQIMRAPNAAVASVLRGLVGGPTRAAPSIGPRRDVMLPRRLVDFQPEFVPQGFNPFGFPRLSELARALGGAPSGVAPRNLPGGGPGELALGDYSRLMGESPGEAAPTGPQGIEDYMARVLGLERAAATQPGILPGVPEPPPPVTPPIRDSWDAYPKGPPPMVQGLYTPGLYRDETGRLLLLYGPNGPIRSYTRGEWQDATKTDEDKARLKLEVDKELAVFQDKQATAQQKSTQAFTAEQNRLTRESNERRDAETNRINVADQALRERLAEMGQQQQTTRNSLERYIAEGNWAQAAQARRNELTLARERMGLEQQGLALQKQRLELERQGQQAALLGNPTALFMAKLLGMELPGLQTGGGMPGLQAGGVVQPGQPYRVGEGGTETVYKDPKTGKVVVVPDYSYTPWLSPYGGLPHQAQRPWTAAALSASAAGESGGMWTQMTLPRGWIEGVGEGGGPGLPAQPAQAQPAEGSAARARQRAGASSLDYRAMAANLVGPGVFESLAPEYQDYLMRYFQRGRPTGLAAERPPVPSLELLGRMNPAQYGVASALGALTGAFADVGWMARRLAPSGTARTRFIGG